MEGQGNFSGIVSKRFAIKPKDIAELTVVPIADQYYTGYEIRPQVRVEIDAYTPLILYEDYTVKYRDNVNVVMGYVQIEGRGKYTGSVETSFRILKKPQDQVKEPAGQETGPQKGVTYRGRKQQGIFLLFVAKSY